MLDEHLAKPDDNILLPSPVFFGKRVVNRLHFENFDFHALRVLFNLQFLFFHRQICYCLEVLKLFASSEVVVSDLVSDHSALAIVFIKLLHFIDVII